MPRIASLIVRPDQELMLWRRLTLASVTVIEDWRAVFGAVGGMMDLLDLLMRVLTIAETDLPDFSDCFWSHLASVVEKPVVTLIIWLLVDDA